MEHRAFGNAGFSVPAVGMGTWSTFDVSSAAESALRRQVVDAAIGAGTTLFDTSPMYGKSQQVLSGALSGRREEVLVADKVWTPSGAEAKAQIGRALAWYGGRVDIYQVHNLVSWREHLPLLEDLQSQGVVKVLGATHYSLDAMRDLMKVMETGRIGMIQVPYNAVNRAVEREVLPLAAELGLGVLVMQPLGSGRLARQSHSARELEPLQRFGVTTWAQALLKWILSDPRVHCVIPATSKPERAIENAGAGDAPWFDEGARDYVARLAMEGTA